MTRYEQIKSMSLDEMAMFLKMIHWDSSCPASTSYCNSKNSLSIDYADLFKMWLSEDKPLFREEASL